MPIKNLWPAEITNHTEIEGPAVILKEQATLLGQTTKNLVEAQVESDSDNVTGNFIERFVVYSAVINYRYELFSVQYPFEFYPLTIWWDGYGGENDYNGDGEPVYVPGHREVDSREWFEQELENIFSNSKTVRIIQAIISRSRE